METEEQKTWTIKNIDKFNLMNKKDVKNSYIYEYFAIVSAMTRYYNFSFNDDLTNIFTKIVLLLGNYISSDFSIDFLKENLNNSTCKKSGSNKLHFRDILTLNDNTKRLIGSIINYENNVYLLLIEMDEKQTVLILKKNKSNYNIVDDNELINKIIPLFIFEVIEDLKRTVKN